MESESNIFNGSKKKKITAFYCINAFKNGASIGFNPEENLDVREVKLPCSSSIKDVYLLRAFEADSDAVIVLACNNKQCHRIDGNTRAQKRVEYTQAILKEIGYNEKRLSFATVSAGDEDTFQQIIRKTADELEM